MTPKRAVALASLTIASCALAPHALADCDDASPDPFCGSRASASSASVDDGEFLEEFDAVSDDPNQKIGPARTTRLPDPNDPNGPGGLSDASAVAEIAFDQGVFAVEAGTESAAVARGAAFNANASSRIHFDEELAVTSTSLADGTPVTLRLRCHAASEVRATHDLPWTIAGTIGSTQFALGDLQLYITFGDAQTEHRNYITSGESFFSTGIFGLLTQTCEMTTQAHVGQTSRLSVDLRSITGSMASIYLFPQFPDAATAATAAFVFGIEADTPGVSITSPHFGAVPDFSGVTGANALAHVLSVPVGLPVSVPEPGPISSGVVALLAILATASVGPRVCA